MHGFIKGINVVRMFLWYNPPHNPPYVQSALHTIRLTYNPPYVQSALRTICLKYNPPYVQSAFCSIRLMYNPTLRAIRLTCNPPYVQSALRAISLTCNQPYMQSDFTCNPGPTSFQSNSSSSHMSPLTKAFALVKLRQRSYLSCCERLLLRRR